MIIVNKMLTEDGVKYIVARLLENANEAAEESNADKSDLFAAGRRTAYYEMLDILKTELDVREQDLEKLGLNINLEYQFA